MYPVLATENEKGVYDPGLTGFKQLDDGTSVCVYHARTYEKIIGNPLYDPNRHAMVMGVKFDECGIPVFDLENTLMSK